MDFEVSEFQTELADGIRRLCEGAFPLEAIRRTESTAHVVDRAGWARLGEAGVFHLCLAEEAGGVGLGLAEAALVFEELGRALVPGPLVASHLAAGLVDGADDGSVVVGLVERPVPGAVGTGVLPVVVEHLADLDVLLVLSDAGVERLDPASLVATPLPRPMDPLTPVWSLAGLPAGEPVAGPEVAAWWRRDGAVLTGALQVGMAQWSCDLAVEYAKGRVQFGRPIGGFQLTQAKLADMALELQKGALLALHLGRLRDQSGALRPEQVSAGKLNNVREAIAIARTCRTILGGNGISGEYPVMRHANNLESVLTYEGTSEIHQLVIGQKLTGLSAFAG